MGQPHEVFVDRFNAALCKPPLAHILYNVEKKRWSAPFLKGIVHTSLLCEQQQICTHNEDHLLRVGQNTLFLHDLWQKRLENLLADELLLFGVLLHDIGYISQGLIWQNKSAINHPEKGAELLDLLRSSHWIKTPGRAEARAIIEEYAHLFFFIISSDTELSLKFAQHLLAYKKNGFPIGEPSYIAALSISLGDKLDYFLAERVKNVPTPPTYQENPYYFLCKAVKNYRLQVANNKLKYIATLDTDGLQFSKRGEWHAKTIQAGFENIWQLAHTYSELLGMTFEVVEYS